MTPPIKSARSLQPLFALSLVTFLSSLGFSVVMPFLVFLVTDLGGNAFVMGILGATFSFCQMLGAPLLGALSDRVGRPRVLFYSQVGGMAAWVIFLLALSVPKFQLFSVDSALTGSVTIVLPLALIFLSRAIDGGINGSISVANAYLSDITLPQQRQAGFARLGAASSLGFVIGPFGAGYVARAPNGVAILVVTALVLSTLGSWVVWRFLLRRSLSGAEGSRASLTQPSPRVASAAVGVDSARSTHQVLGGGAKECQAAAAGVGRPAEFLRSPGVLLAIALYFLVFFGFSIFVTSLPLYAVETLHWTSDRLGMVFGVISLSLIVTQTFALPRLGKIISTPTLAAVGSLLVAVSYVMAAELGTDGPQWAAVAYGVGNGLMWPSYLSLLAATGRERERGRLQGVASSAGSAASIIGMLTAGASYRLLGPTTFIAAAVSLVLSAVLFLFMHPGSTVEP